MSTKFKMQTEKYSNKSQFKILLKTIRVSQ